MIFFTQLHLYFDILKSNILGQLFWLKCTSQGLCCPFNYMTRSFLVLHLFWMRWVFAWAIVDKARPILWYRFTFFLDRQIELDQHRRKPTTTCLCSWKKPTTNNDKGLLAWKLAGLSLIWSFPATFWLLFSQETTSCWEKAWIKKVHRYLPHL